MRNKAKLTVLMTLSLTAMIASAMPVYAQEVEVVTSSNGSGTEIIADTIVSDAMSMQADVNLFEKQYKVISDTVIMRSGPGTSYSAEGTLYKGDILYVKSISNGWAKFKVSGEWRYVPESAIERV
ncbi:MAG: SH3 domain-containing protein [Lachnospiraceae bacterium]|nr:SH3 domain-containing protein [Lachnospiraceae bacterium]